MDKVCYLNIFICTQYEISLSYLAVYKTKTKLGRDLNLCLSCFMNAFTKKQHNHTCTSEDFLSNYVEFHVSNIISQQQNKKRDLETRKIDKKKNHHDSREKMAATATVGKGKQRTIFLLKYLQTGFQIERDRRGKKRWCFFLYILADCVCV